MAYVNSVEFLVSTLLEILGRRQIPPHTRRSDVSTLLEILELVCLVVVGF